MLIQVTDPNTQTILFSIVLLGLLLISLKKASNQTFFSKEVTNQLKGFAILAVLFSHLGYFLSSDTKFLYPLSVLGGTGVNIFLFLSGFGLTISQLHRPLSVFSFYKKKLLKLFLPLWITLIAVISADFFILHRSYSVTEVIQSVFGFYPRADIFQNLDSPLWYFSIILFYYLVFPLAFIRQKIVLISPLIVLVLSLVMLNLPLPVHSDVLKLYKLHFLAFPLGIWFTLVVQNIKVKLGVVSKIVIIITALMLFAYTATHSGVGQSFNIEQNISLLTTLATVVIFSLSKLNFRLFYLFGVYSYEIYLLHLPLLARFNLFLSLPPFLMVILNLILLLVFSFSLQKLTSAMAQKMSKEMQ